MSLRITESGARISGAKTDDAEYIIDTSGLETLSVHAVYTVAASTALTFDSATEVDVDTDELTIPTHGLATGRKLTLSTTGVLPTGLAAGTYYAIAVDANTIKLATSLLLAQAGTAVDITAIGTGTHTLTPAALAGGNIKLQESNDLNAEFIDISGSTAAITATGASIFKPDVRCAYVKIKFDITDGQIDISAFTCGKGYS